MTAAGLVAGRTMVYVSE